LTEGYYDRPVIKPPVWTWEVPWYFFAGGMAGGSSVLASVARLAGNEPVAAAARRVAFVGALASPALLISDLGVRKRFANMLRVVKPTSPMSMGAWLLAGYAPAAGAAALLAESGRLPRLQRATETVAAGLGPLLATYTGALVAATAVPVWHEARRELPFAFAGGAVASAGAAVTLLLPTEQAAPARRVVLVGAVLEGSATSAMERRLGDLSDAYREGVAGRYAGAARALTTSGATIVGTLARRSRAAAIIGSTLVIAGAVCERWSVFRAGFQSAQDPRQTIEPQRARLAASPRQPST